MRKFLTCCSASALLGLLAFGGLLLFVLPAALGLLADLDRQPVLRLLPGEAQTIGALQLTLHRVLQNEDDLVVQLAADNAAFAIRFSGEPTLIQNLASGHAIRIMSATPAAVRLQVFLPAVQSE